MLLGSVAWSCSTRPRRRSISLCILNLATIEVSETSIEAKYFLRNLDNSTGSHALGKGYGTSSTLSNYSLSKSIDNIRAGCVRLSIITGHTLVISLTIITHISTQSFTQNETKSAQKFSTTLSNYSQGNLPIITKLAVFSYP